MPYDGNGTFLPLPSPTFPAVSGQVIYADYFNLNMGNVHSGLSDALPRNGEAAMTGDLLMAGFRIRNVAAGAVEGDLVEWKQWTDTFLDATYTVLQVNDLTGTPGGTRVPNLNWVRNYVTGVSGDIVYQALHNFTGATVRVITKAAGTDTTEAASTQFVQQDFLSKFPNYTAVVNASSAELNYLVGLTGPIQPQLSNQVAGPTHVAAEKVAPALADELPLVDSEDSWNLKKFTFSRLKDWITSLFVARAGSSMSGAFDEAPAVTLASAATVNIGGAAANTINVTGATTITSFGVYAGGALRLVVFGGTLTLTHNAASLILPSGGNITTAAGDTATMLSLGGGNWRCVSYSRANGQSVVANTLATPYTNIGTNTTVAAFSRNRLTASVTLTLPAAPTNGDWVDILNSSGTMTAVVGRNGQSINGVAEDMTLDNVYASTRLVFVTGAGWYSV